MSKRIFFLLIVSLILTTTVFAQKTDDFLGTWKLAETGNKWLYKRGIKTMSIIVTEKDNNLVVERSGEGAVKTNFPPSIETYKLDEETDVKLLDARYAVGVQYRRLRILKPNKLQFLTTVRSADVGGTLTRMTWQLSEDGKTLTVRQEGLYGSNKIVYIKQ